jgi:23S rRNA (cytosine1962-C5)-methyltransferase
MAGLVVRPRARILHGHDWVYATEVLKTFGDPQDGEVVSIKDGRDRLLGTAIYNSASQIVARRISHRRQDLDKDFFVRRIALAQSWRERAGCDLALCRLVWSEADGLPGVIADRYGDVIVLQTLTKAMDGAKRLLAECFAELPGVSHVVERNDAAVRALERLPAESGCLVGHDPGERVIELGGTKFLVNFLSGHKTGLYLDQAENYRAVACHAGGLRVLDCFSNQGGFALACALAGATSVTAIESSAGAAARLNDNAALNAVALDVLQEDVFDVLPRLAKREEKFDLVILDPPSFTRAKGKIHDALRGYEDLHRLATPLLAPNAMLATFSCSHHVSQDAFLGAIASGFSQGRKSAHVIAALGQPMDHPVALHLPETSYLKGFLLVARPSF